MLLLYLVSNLSIGVLCFLNSTSKECINNINLYCKVGVLDLALLGLHASISATKTIKLCSKVERLGKIDFVK